MILMFECPDVCVSLMFVFPRCFNILDVSEFNLGPLHELDPLIHKVYELRRHEYLYKRKACGNLATHFSLLADSEEGSSTKNHRKNQSEKCHLPIQFFKEL